MKSPADKTVVFRFGSHPTPDPRHRWNAALFFPPQSTAETVLGIEITDGENNAVESAVFEFAGKHLPVAGGKAAISYSDFIKGKHSVPLWLHRDGIEPVPGGLTFA